MYNRTDSTLATIFRSTRVIRQEKGDVGGGSSEREPPLHYVKISAGILTTIAREIRLLDHFVLSF